MMEWRRFRVTQLPSQIWIERLTANSRSMRRADERIAGRLTHPGELAGDKIIHATKRVNN